MNIISAREAFDKGLTRYFTGKACKNGHIVERMISNGSCVFCLNEKSVERRKRDKQDIYEATKVWRLKNPDSRRLEAEKYRKKYPEKIAANQKNCRQRNIDEIRKRERENAMRLRKANPDKEKARIKKFIEKKALLRIKEAGRDKPGVCEICLTNDFRIVFDHCHNSGKFRGWICDRCNRVLGIVKDSPQLLKKLALYLEKANDKA